MTILRQAVEKGKQFFLEHPFWSPWILALLFAWVWFLGGVSITFSFRNIRNYRELVVLVLWATLFNYPFVLTVLNLALLCKPRQGERLRHAGRVVESASCVFGVPLTWLCMFVGSISYSSDYTEQLYNNQKHAPIFTDTWPTIAVLAFAAIAGYVLLRVVPLKKQPPLVTVLALSGLYIGMALCITYIVQIIHYPFFRLLLFLLMLPVNLVLIALKVIKEVTLDWRALHAQDDAAAFGGRGWLLGLHRLLCRACMLPMASLVLALPLLGILIALLTLLGQAPDAIIQAWTQTADWTFSQQTAPPNVVIDQHYLCTVAAGGHRRLVKPLRMGRRHGHEVIVNRQLCVANAFEQLLEERTPHVHHIVRRFYDSFGYPIAGHIRTKTAADAVYILMKPLEWCFVAVLYLCDIHPEDRIAVQYPHASLPQELFIRKGE